MTQCKDIKDLILTDYIDAQLDIVLKKQVERHLSQCASCQAFAKEVKINLIIPFEKNAPQAVPSHLWEQIKEKIVTGSNFEEKLEPIPTFLDQLKGWIGGRFLARLVPVLCSFLMVIFVGSLGFFNQQTKQAQDKEQVLYLAAVLSSTGTIGQTGAKSFGTPIETYFL